MREVLLYLIQVILASGILYGYYHLVLRNREFHQYNRFYLLSAAVISLLVPFLQIPVYFSDPDGASAQMLRGMQVIYWSGEADDVTVVARSGIGSWGWQQWLTMLYAVVGTLLLCRLLVSLYKIHRLLKSHSIQHLQGIHFISTEAPGTPFTFFRWLFWDKRIDLESNGGQQIFRHEVYHIQQKHSWDVLFMEVVRTLCWINPFFHLMRRELKAIHEFLADRFAINEQDKWTYAEFLLMQALQTSNRLVNPFFQSQIKRRIAMITNSQKTSHRYLRKVLALPLAALVLSLVAFKVKNDRDERMSPDASAHVNNLSPLSTVPVLNEPEAITLEWKDTVPAVKPKDNLLKTAPSEKVTIRLRATDGLQSEPLIILDGKPLVGPNALDTLNPNLIEQIQVLKDKTATSMYGDKAKDGAILITTKGNASMANGNIEEVVVNGYAKSAMQEVVVQGYPAAKTEEVVVSGYAKPKVDEVVVQGYGVQRKTVNVENVQITGTATLKAVDTPNEVVVVGRKSENVQKTAGSLQLREVKLENVEVTGVRTEPKTLQLKPVAEDELQEVVVVGFSKNQQVKEPAATIFASAEKPAAPKGGEAAWRKHLERTLDVNIGVRNNAPLGKYTVKVRFVVMKDGSVSQIIPLTAHGYGMEEEAIRVIKNSPGWTPAEQNGSPVNSYRIQPISFVVVSDKQTESTVQNKGATPSLQLADPSIRGTLYPNPSDNKVMLTLQSDKEEEVTLRVMDMNGKYAGVQQRSKLVRGNNQLTLAVDKLSKGTYLLQLIGTGGQQQTYKLIKN